MLTEPGEVGVERLDEFREADAETGARPIPIGVKVDVVAAGEFWRRPLAVKRATQHRKDTFVKADGFFNLPLAELGNCR
jgi:hypothetical protein